MNYTVHFIKDGIIRSIKVNACSYIECSRKLKSEFGSNVDILQIFTEIPVVYLCK